MSGQKFGRWTVKDFAFVKNENAYWNCVCECGTERVVHGATLRNGSSTNCGCFAEEQRRKACTKHGLCGTPDYDRAELKRRREKKKMLDTNWTSEMESCIRKLFDLCVVCGLSNKEHLEKYGTSLHVDHVLALHTGNGLTPGNAAVLCTACNSSKSIKSLDNLPLAVANSLRLSAELFKLVWEKPEVKYSYLGEL